MMDTYQMYLRTLQQGLKLDPEETRTVMAEVRGNLEDLAAHLRAQGYAADEAAAEAVRRFDDARDLARDIQRARRGAPLPLQVLALLLVSGGLTGVLLGGDALLTAIIALVRHTDTLMVDYGSAHTLANTIMTGGTGWWLGNILVAVNLLGPGVGLLSAAGLSLWLGMVVLCGMTRVPWRRAGMVAGLVVLADLVLAFALLGTVPHAVPRPVAIPGRAALLAAGLRFQPAPGQPSGPIVVDSVFADRTATYVQFHVPDAARDGEPAPSLIDDQGRSYDIADCTPCNVSAQSGHPQPGRIIQQLMPWRTAWQGLAQFAPLRSDAREAVVQFGGDNNSPARETVHVPVNLAPWRRLTGGAHPFIVVSAHGVRVNLTRVLRGLTSTMIDYTVDATPAVVPRGWFIATFNADLADAHGQPIETVSSSPCLSVNHGGAHCGPESATAALPRGTRLTLTVRSFVVYSQQSWPVQRHRAVVGPWRIQFVMP